MAEHTRQLWFDLQAKGMLCYLCGKHDLRAKNGTDVWSKTPCTTLEKYSITKHMKSDIHQQALKMEKTLQLSEVNGGITAAFDMHINLERRAFIGALRCMYWICKNEIAHTTKFKSLVNLVQSLGCTYLEHLHKGENASYMSERTMQEMVDVLASVIRSNIIQQVQDSPFYSLLMDETTDISILKQLIMYVKYIDRDSHVKTSFLHIQDIFNGTAETIENTTVAFCEKNALCINPKMVGLGSDGAAVMTGKKTGVATRMRVRNPILVNIHCVAHRLALAAAQALDGIKYLHKVSNILQQLYYYYQNSPVRMSGLKEIQAILSEPQIKLKEAKNVRWLSHHRAVEAVRKTLPALITSLERESEERGDATAHGLALFVKSYKFIASIHLLADVLPHLTRLSVIFQKKNIHFSMIEPVLHSTITVIKQLKDTPGIHLQSVRERLNGDLAIHDISVSERLESDFKTQIQDKYIQNIVQNLEDRFPDVELLQAFGVFDPASIEDDIDDTCHQEQLKKLYNHFEEILSDEDELFCEWQVARELINTRKEMTQLEIMNLLVKQYKDILPNLYKLACIALVIPASTADCERGFSGMGRVKTTLRNRLSTTTLNNLLFITLEGPALAEFDFEQAADVWAKKQKRRLNVSNDY